MISRGVFMVVLVGLAACGTASPEADQVKQAWKASLEGPGCSQRHMVTADRRWLKFIVSGCGSMEEVQMSCDDQQCAREVVSQTRLDEPKRLKPAADNVWADPSSAGDTRRLELKPAEAVRLTDVLNDPQYKPTLPKEINRAGMLVWGLYRICVTSAGGVDSVSVVRSALPGGLDAHWISRIENWKYAPHLVDGRPTPFCHPTRIDVRSQH